jgi:hypothetical protein
LRTVDQIGSAVIRQERAMVNDVRELASGDLLHTATSII